MLQRARRAYWAKKMELEIRLGFKRYGRVADPTTQTVQSPHRATISAVVTRADGTVEDLGVIWGRR